MLLQPPALSPHLRQVIIELSSGGLSTLAVASTATVVAAVSLCISCFCG
jgi:hypothetical protein